MTGSRILRVLPWASVLLLVACGGGPRGDWREAFGRPTANPVVLTPALPLVAPATLELPPPGGANLAAPGR